MKLHPLFMRLLLSVIVVVLLVTGILMSIAAAGIGPLVPRRAAAGPPQPQTGDNHVSGVAAVVAGQIGYQGRLLDAGGAPVADGLHTLTFRLFDVAAGGAALWSETKSVTASDGLFITHLGDTTVLDLTEFNGQALWLEIVADGETLSPRQPLLPVPYALSLRPGAIVGGDSSNPVIEVVNTGVGTAIRAQGSAIGVEAEGMTGVEAEGDVGVHGTGPIGVRGDSTTGDGVYGETGSPAHDVAGVHGKSINLAPGVFGEAPASTGVRGSGGACCYGGSFSGATGVYGLSSTGLGDGVYGESSGRYGVYGQSTDSHGVYGTTTATAGHGVHGEVEGSAAIGVYGTSTGIYGVGIFGNSEGDQGQGVYGEGPRVGVFGYSFSGPGMEGYSQTREGVFGRAPVTGTVGIATNATGATYGVYGENRSANNGAGVYGHATASGGVVGGVVGVTNSASGAGVSGGGPGYGVYGISPNPGFAGYFQGRVQITGTLTKGGGGFKIDHPLDPDNQYLNHSFVESPDMLNVYNGNVVLDSRGEAWVTLPDWFQVLNRDFRYQLTCIGGFAPVYIAAEVEDNRFRIAGGEPGMTVSWQVTGVRQDPWAAANRIPVEEPKSAAEQDKYLHPTLYGQPASRAIGGSVIPVELQTVGQEGEQ
jgi:hypothetical protein